MLFLPSLLPLDGWSVFQLNWEKCLKSAENIHIQTYQCLTTTFFSVFLPITRDRLLMALSEANYSTHIVDTSLLSCTRLLFQKAFSLLCGSTAFMWAINNLIFLKKNSKNLSWPTSNAYKSVLSFVKKFL